MPDEASKPLPHRTDRFDMAARGCLQDSHTGTRRKAVAKHRDKVKMDVAMARLNEFQMNVAGPGGYFASA